MAGTRRATFRRSRSCSKRRCSCSRIDGGGGRVSHWLLRYDLAPDYLDRRAALRADHLAVAWAASDAGDLLLGGAVGDASIEALLLFTTAAAAEAFAARDPYVSGGLVTAWRVEEWKTVVGPTAATPLR